MAVPGPITLNSLVPGTASLTANYTNPSIADTDRIFLQVKETTNTAWVTVELIIANDPTFNSMYEGWGLEGNTAYDIRLRAISDADGYGPWSNTLTQTTLVDSFGPPLVAYDEDGVQPGPIVNNTNGTIGAAYNLNTVIGNAGNLTNQVRNGRPVWQSSGGAGLKTNPTPPSPAINQPCTIYVALVPFFLDGTDRIITQGGFNNIRVGARSDGFTLTSGLTGVYGVGSPITDGRLYVLECQVNNTATKLRVMDDQGNDSGEVTGSIGYGGSISPESMGWNFAQDGSHDLPAQFMEFTVYPGLGTAAERNARREELFQKWEFDAVDLIEYRTGTSSNTTASSAADGDGAAALGGDVSPVTDPALLASEGTAALFGSLATPTAPAVLTAAGGVALGGSMAVSTRPATLAAVGTVDTPPPPSIVPPQAPDFQRMYGHLLPSGEAFKLQ